MVLLKPKAILCIRTINYCTLLLWNYFLNKHNTSAINCLLTLKLVQTLAKLELGFAGYVMLFVWSTVHVMYTQRKWEPSAKHSAKKSVKNCNICIASCLLATNDFIGADGVFSFGIFDHAYKSIISASFVKFVIGFAISLIGQLQVTILAAFETLGRRKKAFANLCRK